MSTGLNYETFVNDNEVSLKEFHNKRIIVTYGGGKDASSYITFSNICKKRIWVRI